jgi:hypothetical protein
MFDLTTLTGLVLFCITSSFDLINNKLLSSLDVKVLDSLNLG